MNELTTTRVIKEPKFSVPLRITNIKLIISYISSSRNQRLASRALQGGTNKLDAWAAERRLTFSHNKAINMIFIKRRNINEKTIEIMLRNKIIPSKEST